MNRGSAVGKSSWVGYATRFNEAPIHESGKCFWSAVSDTSMTSLQ